MKAQAKKSDNNIVKPVTVTKTEQRKIDAAKRAVEKASLAKDKAAKAAREKAAREKAAKDKKNQSELDRAAALKRADDERARQQKELEAFQAAQALLKLNAGNFESSQKVFVMLDKDCYGITALGIATGLVRSDLYANAVWDGIAAIDDIDVCIARLNEVYPMLTDEKKQTLIKGMQNRCSPSNVGKRSVIMHLVGKIGCKGGVFTKITQAESDLKAAAARAAAEKRAEEKRLEDEKKAREQSLKAGAEPQVPKQDENKPIAMLSTVVSSEPLPSGTEARKRNIANLIVQIIDTYSLDEIESIITQLDEHVTANRIVLQSVVNG